KHEERNDGNKAGGQPLAPSPCLPAVPHPRAHWLGVTVLFHRETSPLTVAHALAYWKCPSSSRIKSETDDTRLAKQDSHRARTRRSRSAFPRSASAGRHARQPPVAPPRVQPLPSLPLGLSSAAALLETHAS